ncbi:MAG TPA: hypothetical protein DCL44_04450 [Elusimicrobia bacterium]|nr:hypothetical protein [Elusimicrobiota bacterium]
MKYEAKNVGGMATSQAAVTPWVYIDQTAAVAACSALGSGYHLLTIPEAQTINRDIEAQAVNWADGTIGSLVSGGGGLKRGNVGIGDSASYSIGAAADYGVAPSADRILKAKLVLSNGGELWDWSGNVWEWIYGAGASGTLGTPGGVTFDVTTWYEWNSAASPDLSQERPVLGPSNSGWTGSYGVGSYWGGATNKAVVRGGNWTHGALAGVFALYSNSNMSDSTVDFGFRCSWTTTDAQAPSVPTNLAAVAVSSNQINLSWAASYDNIGVTSYKIYRNGGGTPIATPTGTAYSDTGLTPSTTYSYTVSACDAAGNCSAQSSAASSVVPSGNITIAPGFGIFFETGQVLAAASNPDMRNGPPDTINFRPTGFGAGEVMYKIIPGCTGISNIASVDTTGYTSPAGPTGSAVTGDCYAVYLPNATYAAFEITGVSPMLISYKYQPNGTNLF